MRIKYIDRESGKEAYEEVYGGQAIDWLYSSKSKSEKKALFSLNHRLAASFKKLVGWLVSRKLLSVIYGAFQKSYLSRKKVDPFIRQFNIKKNDFLEPVDGYSSFNDFFIRKIRLDARPIDKDPKVAICPADGRYQVYPNLSSTIQLAVKGKQLSGEQLLQACGIKGAAEGYSLVKVRLCPVDYHRYHFPFDCIVTEPRIFKGPLLSVNPIALGSNPSILLKNHRIVSFLKSEHFGEVIFVEVGATFVGTIHQTYTQHQMQYKAEEKGYFSFGGSMLLLFFRKDKIQWDSDFLSASDKGLELYAKMGTSLGRAF